MKPWHLTWLVAAREVLERVRERTYILSTAVVVIAAAGLVVGAEYLPGLFEDGPRTLAVTSDIPAGLREQLPLAAQQAGIELELRPVESAGAARRLLDAGEVDAVLLDQGAALFRSEADAALVAVLSRARYLADLPGVLAALGLTEEPAQRLLEAPPVTVELADPQGAQPDDRDARTAISSASVILLYLALAVYGSWILTGVVEEKASRVVEVLLGALRPAELLAGKVLGVLALAALQLAAGLTAIVVALVVTGYKPPDIAADVAVVSVAALILGLLLYSFAFASLGATASRPADASNLANPLLMAMLVPYLVGLMVIPTLPTARSRSYSRWCRSQLRW